MIFLNLSVAGTLFRYAVYSRKEKWVWDVLCESFVILKMRMLTCLGHYLGEACDVWDPKELVCTFDICSACAFQSCLS